MTKTQLTPALTCISQELTIEKNSGACQLIYQGSFDLSEPSLKRIIEDYGLEDIRCIIDGPVSEYDNGEGIIFLDQSEEINGYICTITKKYKLA